ncbi:LysR family transcriptional regulator [Bombiscardovia nodaiensis]|uniref:LysR family transcriptional regulator n=1 Tax=Bombiscardovia nodaiensis TaxID=2932181 RepID=A0ABM8B763_9BIFI|nr:LysR family transcriptional regulator [Bombiscardovia nodaiensis]
MIEIKTLEIFLAAAQEENFSRAAEKLFLPQSVVSEHIKRLERELGVQLFDRSHRNAQLTATGRTATTLALAVVKDLDALRLGVKNSQDTRQTTGLRLVIGKGMAQKVAHIASRLRADNIFLHITEAEPAQRVAMIEEGRADAAILRGRRASQMDHAEHVWDDIVVAAVNAAHPSFGSPTIAVQSLQNTSLALVPRRGNPMLVDLISKQVFTDSSAMRRALPFTSTEITFAQMAVSDEPLWAPIYLGYESEHTYEGIWSAPIEPTLRLPAYLLPSAQARATNQQSIDALLKACQHI